MNNAIDHTLLKPWVTEDNIKILCEETQKYDFRGVCINPRFVKFAKKSPVLVSAVVDFPLGCSLNKIDLAKEAINFGADEIDIVWDLSRFLKGKYLRVVEELAKIINLGTPVKVIVESCFLSTKQQEIAHHVVKDSGAWCIKTSTGFFGGVMFETIALWTSMGGLKIKASGGIKTYLHAKALLDAGADIIGTSAGVRICSDIENKLVSGLENFATELENADTKLPT